MDGWPQNICRCLTKITEVASITPCLPGLRCLPCLSDISPVPRHIDDVCHSFLCREKLWIACSVREWLTHVLRVKSKIHFRMNQDVFKECSFIQHVDITYSNYYILID